MFVLQLDKNSVTSLKKYVGHVSGIPFTHPAGLGLGLGFGLGLGLTLGLGLGLGLRLEVRVRVVCSVYQSYSKCRFHEVQFLTNITKVTLVMFVCLFVFTSNVIQNYNKLWPNFQTHKCFILQLSQNLSHN